MRTSWSRKVAWIPVAVLAGVVSLPSPRASARGEHHNPIVIENQHPGSDLWRLPWAGNQVADDIGLQIKAFSHQPATRPGGELELAVTVTPAQKFDVDILRLGYYGGHGGRLMRHIAAVNGSPQPACTSDPTTLMLSCGKWRTAVELRIPEDWLSGAYVAVL